jgi:hypothetical protein
MRPRRRLSRVSQVVGMCLVLSCTLAAVGFGVLNVLPRPSQADRFGVAVLAKLGHERRTSAEVHLIGWRVVRTTCVRWHRRERLAAGTMQLTLDGSWIERRSGALRYVPGNVVAGLADLAVCPGVVASDLQNRVLAGALPRATRARWHGRLAYRLRVSHGRPVLFVYLSRNRLLPLGALFLGRRIRGWSVVRSGGAPGRTGGRASA